MRQTNRGMVLLTALIMMTMLGLMTTSALRSASVSTLDMAWIQNEWRTRLALDQALRQAITASTIHPTTDANEVLRIQGVDLSWNRTTFGHYAPTRFWSGGSCAQILVTGQRSTFTLTHEAIVCVPIDPTQSILTTWRELTP